jgi:hypothetical protein
LVKIYRKKVPSQPMTESTWIENCKVLDLDKETTDQNLHRKRDLFASRIVRTPHSSRRVN